MFLLIDWGNSFLKYKVVDELTTEAIFSAEVKQVEKLSELTHLALATCQGVLISSVRDSCDNLALEDLVGQYSDNLFWAKTATKACGVSCAYSQPSQLGIDRWLAVLAADQVSDNIAVISVGSAVTLDLVKNHQHLGGHIVPGLRLLMASLAQTGQVKADKNFVHKSRFVLGRSTTECVHQGIETLLASYLQELVHQCEQQYQVNKILFCGGGGAYWAGYFDADSGCVEHYPHLVFQGLVRLYLAQ